MGVKYLRTPLLMLAILILLSCNMPSLRQVLPGMPPEQTLPAGGEETPAVDITTTPEPEQPFIENSYYELYSEGVNRGRWGKGDGLLALLRYFSGQGDVATLLAGNKIEDWETTPLLWI